MDWSNLLNIIREPENPRLDFKESKFLDEHPDEIAADLVSFVNRYGGKIVVGVTDDASIEGASINYNQSALHVSNIAINNCSAS
jgi:predicted HTH transcriptional regulator